MKSFIIKITCYAVVLFVVSKYGYEYLLPVFEADHLIFPYALHPFDICEMYPETWHIIKNAYVAMFLISFTIVFFYIVSSFNIRMPSVFKNLFTSCKQKVDKSNGKKQFSLMKQLYDNKKNKQENNENLELLIGQDEQGNSVSVKEKGLYQSILITGTIGSGKTSSAMYPFTEQLIAYQADNSDKKLGMLILDVKGNYANQVEQLCKKYNRSKDLIMVDLSGKIRYNPLDKLELKPAVIANRLRTILTLFSKNNSESYWLDKSEQTITEAIKLCRVYNDGYVSFVELHKLIFVKEYFESKMEIIKQKFKKSCLSEEQVYDLISSMDYFQKEFFNLDARTSSIIKSEISIITNIFISDYEISKCFCPKQEDINFSGFEEALKNGKIVVLKMNISKYRNLSKIIATYLKLDFQTAVMNQLSKNESPRKSVFISDEYHEYVTEMDSSFFAECREARCINILATQSYTSLLNSIHDINSTKVILQNLINKLWYRTDDIFTIEEAQKQIGKIEHQKESFTISENAKQTNYNMLTNTLISQDSNISESYNRYMQKDFAYDTNYFSQDLKVFECLAFLSDGNKIITPKKLKMIPYFKKEEI